MGATWMTSVKYQVVSFFSFINGPFMWKVDADGGSTSEYRSDVDGKSRSRNRRKMRHLK